MRTQGRKRLGAALLILALSGLLIWRGIGFFSVFHQGFSPQPQGLGASAPQADELGLVLVDIDREETAKEFHVKDLGVYILAADEQGRAFRSGLRSGDRLLALAGTPVRSSAEVNAALSQEAGAESVTVTLLRQGEEKAVVLALFQEAEP
ncbi:MAG: PDZ domain-containing protein [Candidatus Limiplasma sp.]|nr:PDZ domain-containing protein [Candidatus Limiplasma sp.]